MTRVRRHLPIDPAEEIKRIYALHPETQEQKAGLLRIKRNNRRFGLRKLPHCLDRKNWSEEEWEDYKQSQARINEQIRRHQRLHLQNERKSRLKIKWEKTRKRIRALKREENRVKKDERAAKKVRRSRLDHEHIEQVVAALKNGAVTVGQVCKKTDLETKEARRALRLLVQSGRVEKPSSRQYLLKQRHRRRFADIEQQPTRRRRRLYASRKRSK